MANEQIYSGLNLNWPHFQQDTGNNPSVEQVRAFVDENFSAEGTEFEDWDPEDWHDHPEFLEKIKVSQAIIY